MRLEVETVTQLAQRILLNQGVPAAHAAIQADLLVEAEMRGLPSHGLLRLRRIVERIHNGATDPKSKGRADWARRNYLDVDGQRGLGPVVAMHALDAICPRAADDGIAIVAIHNSNHLGMLAWYVEHVARQGLVLIALTTSEALVHPWGGKKAMLGTNPIAIGVPGDPHPLILDMATSLVAMGKVHDHANRNVPIPEGWALDADGNPTTDAHAAKAGALAPFGGPKGYALGLAIELLVTALSGAEIGTRVRGTLDSTEVCNKGDVFIAIAPKNSQSVRHLIDGYLSEIRACDPADPGRPVAVPGDRARASRVTALTHGLSIDDGLWRDLMTLEQSTSIAGN
jgi:L-2-hydroxycarboxylate dehydrogenase (NAD+)